MNMFSLASSNSNSEIGKEKQLVDEGSNHSESSPIPAYQPSLDAAFPLNQNSSSSSSNSQRPSVKIPKVSPALISQFNAQHPDSEKNLNSNEADVVQQSPKQAQSSTPIRSSSEKNLENTTSVDIVQSQNHPLHPDVVDDSFEQMETRKINSHEGTNNEEHLVSSESLRVSRNEEVPITDALIEKEAMQLDLLESDQRSEIIREEVEREAMNQLIQEKENRTLPQSIPITYDPDMPSLISESQIGMDIAVPVPDTNAVSTDMAEPPITNDEAPNSPSIPRLTLQRVKSEPKGLK